MKRYFLQILFLFFTQLIFSQSQTINFTVNDKDYSLKVTKTKVMYEFILEDSKVTIKKEYSMQTLSLDNFILLTKGHLKKIDSSIIESTINQKLIDIYTVIVNNNEKGPIAGKLIVSNKVNLYHDKIKKGALNFKNTREADGELEITSVSFVVQQGFIQDIKVNGVVTSKSSKYKDYKLSFTNQYGIGFTSKKNYPDLNKKRLFININFGIKKGEVDPESLSVIEELMYIDLGEVLKYDRTLELYTNDFSPADVSGVWKGGQEVLLYKEATFKLFEGRIFTDFAGFESDNPNGLIQIEAEKKVNFNTKRYTFFHPLLRSGVGFFEYLKPFGGFSKIEDSNKFLIPEMIDNPTISLTTPSTSILENKRYTTPIDIIKHQTWRLGVDINITTIDMPLLKSQVFVDLGFAYSRTATRDSIRTFKDATLTGNDLINPDNIKSKVNEFGINYWQFYPSLKIHYSPEFRYGFYFNYKPSYMYVNNDTVNLLGKTNPLDGVKRKVSNFVNEYEIIGYWKVDQNGKLFFRWRLNNEMGYANNYYTQIQLGYSFNVLGNN